MAWLLLPLLANRTASGTFSHSPLLATYSAPAELLENTGVEISPALAPAEHEVTTQFSEIIRGLLV